VRSELKSALRDSSDWHPRLNEEVAKLTDIKNTRIVRSRIYVTSASTMHSLFNILRHGQYVASDGGDDNADDGIVKGLEEVVDLNYLTHIVFRCYEACDDDIEDDENPDSQGNDLNQESCDSNEDLRNFAKAKYRVEISMSAGKQVYEDGQLVQWPNGSQLREENCYVAPLQIVANSVALSKVDEFLTKVVEEYGGRGDADADEDKPSDG
jgi:hypothetical protein